VRSVTVRPILADEVGRFNALSWTLITGSGIG
jgi:hypothetical protein